MADSAPPLQLAAAVSAVVSAFHAAADLVSQLRRRHHAPSRWRSASISTSASTSASTAGTPTVACTKAEQTVKEKLLQDSLAASELHISQRYAAHYAELGTKFQVGDDIARNTLLRLAILLQSELVRSLQIALQHDAARLDWARLQEDALISRRDTISALDGLRGRLVAGAWCENASPAIPSPTLSPAPLSPTLNPHSPQSQHSHLHHHLHHCQSQYQQQHAHQHSYHHSHQQQPCPAPAPTAYHHTHQYLAPTTRRPSLESLRTYLSAYSAPDPFTTGPTPAPVEQPQSQASPPQSPVARFLSLRHTQPPRRTLSTSTAPTSPRSAPPTPTLTPMDHRISAPVPGPYWPDARQPFSAAPTSPTSSSATTFSRHTSTSDRSTLSQSSASDYSDKIPVCSIDEETTSPLARLNLTLLPAHLSPVPSMHLTAPHSPVSSASVPSTLPSPTADSSYQRWSLTAAPPSPSQHPALAPHLHTTSQAAPPLVAAPHLLLGRPSKENNYWGFCRGAWDAREEFTKAVQLHTVPAGLYSSRQVWRCRQCAFEGVAVATAPKPGEKKGLFGRTKRESRVGFDQRVRVFEAASGNGVVRFRWAFLAKSHVKRKTGAATGTMSTGGGGMAGAGLGFGGPLSRSSTSSEGSQSLAGPGQRASMAGLARGPEDGAFGCTFCTGEGRGTGIFGGVAALMEHILDVHGSRGVSWEVAERNRCIMERVAGEDENWDINILPVAGQERKVFQGEWEMEA